MLSDRKTIDLLSLLQDEIFVQRVMDAPNPDGLLDELIRENPGNVDSIRDAFEFIRYNRSNTIRMDSEAYERNLKIIQFELKKRSSNRFMRVPNLYLRIAAMILVILSIGSLVVYQQFKKDPMSSFAQNQVLDSSQALIVLSDGSIQALKSNGSIIDYKSNSGNVIVRNDKAEERIENQSTKEATHLNEVVIPYGQRHQILLSDGTLVYLNAGSKLTFPATFTGKTREVYLSGEGFFEVNKNPAMPFIVKTEHLDIRVLGTTFNVTAYQDEQFTTAVLVEGRVNVRQKDKLIANDEFELSPNQGCIYSNILKNSVVKNVDIQDYIIWKDGLFNFRNMPLETLVSRVRKYYNIPVEIEGEKLAETTVTGKLVFSDDVERVMEYLSKTMEGGYEKTEEGVFILKQQ